MISSASLIAVLFKVILIVMSNPGIPQDVKDSVFADITQAIGQERSAEQSPARPSGVSEPQPVASVAEAPVVTSSDMEPTIAITKTAPLSVSIAVTGTKWTKAYYSIVKKGEDGKELVSNKSFLYPDEPSIVSSFEESMAGTFETSWTLYSGTGKDNRTDTGKVLSSGSGSLVIGE
jgi:hypothetical protein